MAGEGGEGGIRTPDGIATIAVFKTAALNLYATSPSHRIVANLPMVRDTLTLF